MEIERAGESTGKMDEQKRINDNQFDGSLLYCECTLCLIMQKRMGREKSTNIDSFKFDCYVTGCKNK